MHHCRTNKLILIFSLLLACTKVFGQDTLNSATVEDKTYQLYTDKKWDELITLGNAAIAKGIDYYFLRMRLGIAYYEEKSYIKAEKNFSKALGFNSGDDNALEYLYYCYIYTNQFEQARWLSKHFDKDLAHRTKTDSVSSIGFIMAEGGIKTSDSTNLFKTGYYFQLGLDHYVAKRFTLFHAASYFSQKDFTGATTQWQYYLRATIPLANSWEIAPAFQWMSRGYTPPPPVKVPLKRGQPPPADTIPSTTYSNYFTYSAALKKTFSNFDFSLGTTISQVYGNTQFLHSVTLNYYPFGWNKLDIGATAYAHTENSYSNIYYAYNPYISLQIVKPVSLMVGYLSNNNGANIIEYNGYLINNSTDLTKSRISFLATFSFAKALDIYALYQYETQIQSTEDFMYHYNVFVMGLLIKP